MKTYRLQLYICPPAFTRQPAFDVTYEVEAYDEELAEMRATANAIRQYNVWREHITVMECERVERMSA